jgi:hypothetical protein
MDPESENGSDYAQAAIRADVGTSRAVIDVTKHQGLASLPGFPFEVRTSASTHEQAGRLADRCARAYSYLGETLAFRPRCALVVLNRADWSERASNPLYGMPYYSAGNLFLAGDPSDLAARLEEVVSSAPPVAVQVLDQVYGTVLRRLWDAFAVSDEQLAGVLGGRVHPAAGQWLASWNELQEAG